MMDVFVSCFIIASVKRGHELHVGIDFSLNGILSAFAEGSEIKSSAFLEIGLLF